MTTPPVFLQNQPRRLYGRGSDTSRQGQKYLQLIQEETASQQRIDSLPEDYCNCDCDAELDAEKAAEDQESFVQGLQKP